jgi:hypothetical protein
MADREFFVGYLPSPPGMRRFVIGLAVAAVAIIGIVGGIIGTVQAFQPTGRGELSVLREFEGHLTVDPVPTLTVESNGGSTVFLLVGAGKFGIPEAVREADRQTVRFQGSLMYREQVTMIEISDPSSFEVLGAARPTSEQPAVEVVGPMTVEGELVDTKCYFGIMRPATGKIHRACAVRCLSGGVPPGVLVRTQGDDGVVFLLAGPEGETLTVDPQWAALFVRAEGVLEIHDGMPVLRTDAVELTGREAL